jgi:hypothetical protein
VHDAHVVNVRDGLEDARGPVLHHEDGQLRPALDEAIEVDGRALHDEDAAVLGGAEDADDVWVEAGRLDVGELVLHRFEHVFVGDVGTGAIWPRADAHFGFRTDDFECDVTASGELLCLVDGGEGALPDNSANLEAGIHVRHKLVYIVKHAFTSIHFSNIA